MTLSGYYKESRVADARVKKNFKQQEEIETVKDVESYKILPVPFRNISEEAAKYFGIRSAVSPEDGRTIIATYYPYRDKYGKITGYKKRDWTKQKEEKGHITVVGVIKISNQLFGQYQVDSGVSRKKLIQLEGEDNVVCAWQAILDNLRDSARNPKCPKAVKDYLVSIEEGITNGTEGRPTIGVVGLSLGTANAAEAVANNEKFIRSFDEYVLALDNDAATEHEVMKGISKGKEATDAIATFLLAENVFSVIWPDERNDPHGLNDPRDFAAAGRYKELAQLLTKCQNKYVPDKVISLADLSIEDLRKKKKDGVPMPMFPELFAKTKGPRKGELWVATGPSGCVDKDTEFLTPQGWKKISEYKTGDQVLQYHEDGSASFVTPEDYIKLPCERMAHIKTRFLDMMLSDEHRIIYVHQQDGNKKLREITLKDALEKHKKYVCGFQGRIPTTFKYSGEGLPISEGELRLQVAVIADGRIIKEGKDNYCQMRFSKERKYLRLLNMCKKFGLRYDDRGWKSCNRYTSGREYEVIVWPKWKDKLFTDRYYNCSQEQLKIIVDEVGHWDGSYEGQYPVAITTVYKESADFIQFALSATGTRAGICQDLRVEKYTNGVCYDVIPNKRTEYVGFAKDVRKNTTEVNENVVPADGFKYCFTVETGMWVMRREGKIIVTGNSGKTTLCRRIEYCIAKYLMDENIPKLEDWSKEERLGIIHLEEDEDESVNSLYAIDLGFDEKDFVANPEDFLTEEEHLKVHNEWIEKDKIKIFDHFGSIPVEDLIAKLKHMVYIDGCKWIILDHLSIVISGLGLADERKGLDEAMTALATFCKQYNVFILAIAHMKRTDFQPPKVKDGDEPKPYWVPVRKEQLRGSAALEQLGFVILAVEPEELPNRERGRVRWVTLKNRPHKKLGVCDTMFMDSQGKFVDASKWEWINNRFVGAGAPEPEVSYTEGEY